MASDAGHRWRLFFRKSDRDAVVTRVNPKKEGPDPVLSCDGHSTVVRHLLLDRDTPTFEPQLTSYGAKMQK